MVKNEDDDGLKWVAKGVLTILALAIPNLSNNFSVRVFYLLLELLFTILIFIRKMRLIQQMVITLKGGGWIGWWSLFVNLKYVNVRDNYMQIYNKTI